MLKLQPPRAPTDGVVRLMEVDDDLFTIMVEHDGVEQTLHIGGYNLLRLFGFIAIVMRVPLSKAVGKAIGLGVVEAKLNEPSTLGEHVAQNLLAAEMKRVLDTAK